MRHRSSASLFLLFALAAIAFAEPSAQPTPMPGSYVHDFAGVLTPQAKADLQAKAQELKDKYKTEIALVTVRTTGEETSFDYSMRMARTWGIGSKDNEIRGLLIVVATQDRKIAFRTSRHIEGELPDGVTGSINRTMGPFFKIGDWGGGLNAGMDLILAREREYYEPAVIIPSASTSHKGAWATAGVVSFFAMLLAFVLTLAFRKRRREGGNKHDRFAASVRNLRNEQASPPDYNEYSRLVTQRAYSPRSSRGTRSRSPRAVRDDPPVISTPEPYHSSRSSDDSSSSSSSSSSHDSGGSSYSGGSDFGGGGSDSSF